MNKELLDTLLNALTFSPDNHVLRKQVVQGLLECERWTEVCREARPLIQSEEHRAFALSALARASFHLEQLDEARQYYRDATALDASYCDEDFEANLDPEESLRLPPLDGAGTATPVREYTGPRITFQDVGGMEALKEQIRVNILYPFSHPEVYAAYGKKIGGGILLFGPPGCGKTHIARATAGELGANFYPLELNQILDMYIGESEKHLNQLFETARANAPAVIFIDEVDTLGFKRGDTGNPWLRMMVSQLLTEMDGIGSRNESLLVLGATNEPWSVDAAFRRPGRFDRVLFVPPPDGVAREEILRLHTNGRKVDARITWRAIAEKADLFSGADLASLVDRACELALRDALRTGNLREVTQQDFQRSLSDMRPSTTEWLRRAKNYVTYANQDGFYDTLAQFLALAKIR